MLVPFFSETNYAPQQKMNHDVILSPYWFLYCFSDFTFVANPPLELVPFSATILLFSKVFRSEERK